MSNLVVDFISSLNGYASGEGWRGWSGLQSPEYRPSMYGFASVPAGSFREDKQESVA